MNNETLSKIFENPKSRSIVFLALWGIFIGYLIVKVVIPYEQSNANETGNTNNTAVNNTINEVIDNQDDITLEEMKKNLLKYNFNYVYTTVLNGDKTVYNGTMFGNLTKGYKETLNGIEKYYVEGTNIYKEIFGERVLVNDKSINVYNNYLSVDNIMEMIQNLEPSITDSVYNFQINDIYVKITVGVNNIEKIEITQLNNVYLLEFKDINQITSLD